MSSDLAATHKSVKRKRGENAGEHFAFFKGALVVGTDWKSLLGTILIIVAPCGIFFGFVASKVGSNISWALVAIVAAEMVLALIFLGLTALRDPGFFPRDDPNRPEAKGGRPAHKEHQVNGFIVQTKWCTTCNHWRPPRCSHCAVCDNCVEKFDHHCPWVGTCVGLRNYRYFLSFIFTCSLLCCSIFAFCLAELMLLRNRRYHSFGTAVRKEPANIVLMAYAFLACCFVGGLSGFHIYLTSSNQTTYEHFRHRYSPSQGNPYSRGIFNNWREACCLPMQKRRREALLRPVHDLEMGYVGDQEAIPAYNSAAPWSGAQSGVLPTNGGNGLMNPLAYPHPNGPNTNLPQGPYGGSMGPPSQGSSSPGGSPLHSGHLVATQHRNPMLQQHEGERDYEQDGTLTGVQNLHTKDDEEETVQEPHEHSLLESIENSESSYSFAMGGHQEPVTDPSPGQEVFQDATSAGASRPDSFVSASGKSFTAHPQQTTMPVNQGDEYFTIPMGGLALQDTGEITSRTQGSDYLQSTHVASHDLSSVPPSHNQPGWH